MGKENTRKDEVYYWRTLAADAAEIQSAVVTQFSPDGFGEWLGTSHWFYVKLGMLVLQHNGDWRYPSKDESLEVRKSYAHRTLRDALTALEKCVAPSVPMFKAIAERNLKMEK